MRISKRVSIKVDESTSKEYNVYEVRPYDIIDKFYDKTEIGESAGTDNDEKKDRAFLEIVKECLPLFTDCPTDDIKTMYPNDIKTMIDSIKSVNEAFFLILKEIGMDRKIKLYVMNGVASFSDQMAKFLGGTVMVNLEKAMTRASEEKSMASVVD